MGNPCRLTRKRNKKRAAADMLLERGSIPRIGAVQQSHLCTNHNAQLNSNIHSTELFHQSLDERELEKLANLFLSNTSASQGKKVAEHETVMSGPPSPHQKQDKAKHKTKTIRDASLPRTGKDCLLSLPPSCAEKLSKKKRLEEFNHKPMKRYESKGRNKIIKDVIVASSNTGSSGHRGFFVDLEDGSDALEETLTQQVLQRAATFLTKLEPADRRLLWDLRDAAQGTQNAKDTVFKMEATGNHFSRALTREDEGTFRVINHKKTVGAKHSVYLKDSILQSDEELGSKLVTSSSSEPSFAPDSDDDIEEGQRDFGADLERVDENKEITLRSQRSQGQNGGRLFTDDGDTWSD